MERMYNLEKLPKNRSHVELHYLRFVNYFVLMHKSLSS